MTRFLLAQFGLEGDDLYRVEGPVNLVRLHEHPRPGRTARTSKYPPFKPGAAEGARQGPRHLRDDPQGRHPAAPPVPVVPAGDRLHPAGGAAIRSVVAIKQTVYRTGTDSVIMETLIDAARAGKEVTVVVELMARFDEEANINWAARLEEVGAHVVYGVVGHKTHAKMALVVRREEGKLVRYAHLGTGNYHPRTARLYTDFGLLTADDEICADVNEVFQQLTGLGKVDEAEARVAVAVHAAPEACSRRSTTRRASRGRASRRASSPR